MQEEEKAVFRSFAIPVSAFDHMKDFQRAYERKHNVRLTNNQVITIIIKEHQQVTKADSGEHHGEHPSNQADQR